MIRKLVISNGRSERELLLVGNIIIGRDPACHVSESDPLLSRRHAEIVANVHGVSVRDLNSRNGILVNGQKTREQVLLPGDVVQLGHLQLRYVEEHVRPADGLASRGVERRPPAPPPQPEASAFDRFRPEASPQASRWRPEPTPLPGRRSSAPPPPPQPAHGHTPVPRGRAAFEHTGGTPPGRQRDRFDETILARPGVHDTTLGPAPVDLDSTILAPASMREPAGTGPWDEPEATMFGSATGEATMNPGDATFAAALSHLAGLGQPGHEQVRPGPGARLVANAELTITDATPACAELLGIPGEALIGDSLTDIFLRGVRRAYSEPDSAVTLSVARGPRGSITVTITLEKDGETDR